MKRKILILFLAISAIFNILFISIPIVTDRFKITTAIMAGISARLIDEFMEAGELPELLPIDAVVLANESKMDIIYERLDMHRAVIRALVRQPLPYITTYICCDVNIDESIFQKEKILLEVSSHSDVLNQCRKEDEL